MAATPPHLNPAQVSDLAVKLLKSAQARGTQQGVNVLQHSIDLLEKAQTDSVVLEVLHDLNSAFVGIEAHGDLTAEEYALIKQLRTMEESSKAKDTYPVLPDKLASQAASYPECSYGATRVVLVMKDGRRIHDVIIGGAGTICKIGSQRIGSESDVGFLISDISDIEKA
jgi:hypothetical protein